MKQIILVTVLCAIATSAFAQQQPTPSTPKSRSIASCSTMPTPNYRGRSLNSKRN